jgi:AraC family transcriptional regulator
MTLYIKNMVCNRCILVVKQTLENLTSQRLTVSLGEVVLEQPLTASQTGQVREALASLGFELLDDQKQRQIEKIKNLLLTKLQSDELEVHFSLSEYLGTAVKKDYSNISRLFSEVEGITIEQYFILLKIEKAKEWLAYDQLSLKEIAWKLGYSSTAHLSAQFKKVTGLTSSHFKTTGHTQRKPLDNL